MEHSKNRQTITGILVSMILIFATFTILGEAVASHASPLVVDDDGEASVDSSSQADCDSDTTVNGSTTFDSIQAAIDYDVGGESHFIIVCPGEYSEIVIESDDGFDKIYGFPGAIIDEDDDGDNGVDAVEINGVCSSTDRLILDGFEIKNGEDGVDVEDSCRVFIQDNNIHDNTDDGVKFQNTDDSWIHRNEVHLNGDEGIELEDNSNNNFIGSNRVHDNVASGIRIDEDDDPPTSINNVIAQNIVENNGDWGICLCGSEGASNNKARGNRAIGNGADVTIGGSGNYKVEGTGNILTSNKALSTIDGRDGFRIDGSGNTLKQNLAKENGGAGPAGEGFQVTATGNTLTKNKAIENAGFGIQDDTAGAGTAGTGNTYTLNTCDDNDAGGSFRAAVGPGDGFLCSPQNAPEPP